MNVRLTQIDGKLPNLALMKLARHHLERGDMLHFTKQWVPTEVRLLCRAKEGRQAAIG